MLPAAEPLWAQVAPANAQWIDDQALIERLLEARPDGNIYEDQARQFLRQLLHEPRIGGTGPAADAVIHMPHDGNHRRPLDQLGGILNFRFLNFGLALLLESRLFFD